MQWVGRVFAVHGTPSETESVASPSDRPSDIRKGNEPLGHLRVGQALWGQAQGDLSGGTEVSEQPLQRARAGEPEPHKWEHLGAHAGVPGSVDGVDVWG